MCDACKHAWRRWRGLLLCVLDSSCVRERGVCYGLWGAILHLGGATFLRCDPWCVAAGLIYGMFMPKRASVLYNGPTAG
eukprot:1139293-Pelagomonas_calceolata.AAC.6